ncbi:MAG: 3-deoxy-D-manno-octulosonic acid transferase [Desulfosudaceae bacterium]
MYHLYSLISTILFLVLFPLFLLFVRLTGKYADGLAQRLGRYPRAARNVPGRPRIWLHAASMGEVGVALNMIAVFRELMPGCGLVLSTVTEHGQALARDKAPAGVVCVYAPLDVIWLVRRAVTAVRPEVFVCLETEIWPHLFREVKRSGAVTVIANGRMSAATFGRYRRFRPFFAMILGTVDGFSMISRADADRIRALGVPAGRVVVNGNAKYDHLARRPRQGVAEQMRAAWNIAADEPVLVAGSTRRNEESIIAGVYEQLRTHFPDLLLILVPRHIQRAPDVLRMLRQRGLAACLKSDLDQSGTIRECPAVVVDTMGELDDIYSMATVVFCGGSLVPLGGQNVLEPAAWGVPVFFGPHMDDFADAGQLLLESGGGVQVDDGRELAEAMRTVLADPDKGRAMGRAAQEAVLAGEPAAMRHVRMVESFMKKRGCK